MSTISVPLTPELEKSVNNLVKDGYGSNKADVIRRALAKAIEDEAINAVLRASEEPTLKGDLRSLAKMFK